MNLHRPCILACLALPLAAQGVFKNADKPGDSTCDRVIRDTDELNRGGQSMSGTAAAPLGNISTVGTTLKTNNSTTGAMQGAASDLATIKVKGGVFYPKGKRKSVSSFAAVGENGKATTIGELKEKTVLVAFWSSRCEPSAKMMMELMDLYPKRNKFGFEVLAVNLDENRPQDGIEGGWSAIRKFKLSNAKFFDQSKMPVYVAGIGKQGASNFLDMINSLPLLCVVDPDGNVASMVIGYEPNFVAAQLSRVLKERMPAPKVAK